MADDLDFIWKQPRAAPPRTAPERTSAAEAGPPTRWVLLRDAADQTGLAVSTIRNWARKGRVPTMLAESRGGPRRMVGLEEVLARARKLGRLEEEPAAAGPAPRADGPVPEGHMLVPLDAWEKMLLQLGNLHSAGQDLAEARERAAKAETEASFLRERVAELREERDRLRGDEVAPADRPADPPDPPASTEAWYRRVASRFRKNR